MEIRPCVTLKPEDDYDSGYEDDVTPPAEAVPLLTNREIDWSLTALQSDGIPFAEIEALTVQNP